MEPGKIVYLCWYDFDKKTEHVCKGQVVDNALWADTQWKDYINVAFQPPRMHAAVCHHFSADKLSEDATNVPHDDCYLACGKKTRFFEHDHTVRRGSATSSSPSDAWKQVQQFKQEHWDYAHGHLSIDAIDGFYQLWHDAIAAKLGITVPCNSVARVSPQPVLNNDTVTLPSHSKPTVPATSPAGKRKRSTGSITYNDSIQTSLFE